MPDAITDTLKIALAQLNPVVGDLAGNAEQAAQGARRSAAARVPTSWSAAELFITGYPPEDLVRKPAFAAAARAAIEALAAETGRRRPGRDGRHHLGRGRQALQLRRRCWTAAASQGVRFKVDLPNYGVFDEKRVFDIRAHAGAGQLPRRAHRRADLRGHLAGARCASACRRRARSCSISPNGSPVRLAQARSAHERGRGARDGDRPAAALRQPGRRPGRAGVRRRLLRAQRRSPALPCSCRPGRRRSRVVEHAAHGRRLALRAGPSARASRSIDAAAYHACVLGLRDYVDKNGFPGVVHGPLGRHRFGARAPRMSADALGAERVHCVMLPYRYTSNVSLSRRGRLRQGAGRALRHRADRRAGRRLPARRSARCSRAARPTSPRRTSSPRARHGADGHLQQVRRHGGDDRQQERDVGRLRHASTAT